MLVDSKTNKEEEEREREREREYYLPKSTGCQQTKACMI
jgi:hypothetical protein